MTKTVLIVASCYPPVSAMGSVRMASFVRHLPTHGWKPLLVTARPGLRTVDAGERTSEDPRICRTRAIDVGALVSRALGSTVRRHAVTRSAAASARRHSVIPWALRFYDEALAFSQEDAADSEINRKRAELKTAAASVESLLRETFLGR